MSQPDQPPELDEQQEAFIADSIRKQGVQDIRTTTDYKCRKDIFDALVTKGMPKETAGRVTGGILIGVPDAKYGNEIYQACLENCVNRLYSMWEIYTADMSAEAFFLAAYELKFVCFVG